MILSYWLRLLSLCFASFFLVHATAILGVWIVRRRAIQFAQRLSPRNAARFLLALRLLPTGVAVAAVLGLCAPSYLRFEQNILTEKVGLVCLVLSGLGFAICLLAFDNGLGAAASSLEFVSVCRSSGHAVPLSGNPSRMLVIPGKQPFLAQCGVLRPRIVISHRLLREFSSEELEAALEHERAHWLSRDNCKRLLLAFVPNALPFLPALKTLDQNWAKFAERAADDYVLAMGARPATSLASALVRLARAGNIHDPVTGTLVPFVMSPLDGTDDLSARVSRLLAPAQARARRQSHRLRALLSVTTIIVACVAAGLAWSAALAPLHELLERLIR